MHVRLTTLAAALMVGVTPAWATGLPAYETYSAAAEVDTNFFTGELYVPQSSVTTTPGEIASITEISPIPISNPYTASASTYLGSNHAYAQADHLSLGSIGVGSFSGWYDQVTITGGTGAGSAQFTVQLNGTIDVGAVIGGVGYGLYASSVHPSLLTSSALNMSTTSPWALDGATPITGYTIGVSPYNDPNQISGLFATPPDLLLTPGAGQAVNMTLTGTLNFTYGEAFYLIGGLGTAITNLEAFCTFSVDGTCTSPPVDGTGATILDFSNSANLVNIALPEGATASFASGNTYNVTTVPEPDAWLMLLAGLGLVGWRARRRA